MQVSGVEEIKVSVLEDCRTPPLCLGTKVNGRHNEASNANNISKDSHLEGR